MLTPKANSNPTALSIADGCLGRDQKGKRVEGGLGDHFHLPLRLVGSSMCIAAGIGIAASANVEI